MIAPHRGNRKQAGHARSAKVKPLHATLARRALLRLDSMAAPDPHSLGVPRPQFPRLCPACLPRYSLQTILRRVLIRIMQNRHPVDRLADVRSEIKQLEAEEEQLRAYLLEHPQDRTGQEYAAIVGSQSRRRVDLKALADEIGASVLARFTSFRSMMVVRLREVSGS